jgi:hypothetical protein
VEQLSEEEEKNREKAASHPIEKKVHFHLLINVCHGDKQKINVRIFEWKTTATTQCKIGSKLPSSLARWKY